MTCEELSQYSFLFVKDEEAIDRSKEPLHGFTKIKKKHVFLTRIGIPEVFWVAEDESDG